MVRRKISSITALSFVMVMNPAERNRVMMVIKLIGAPVIYCWRASAERMGELPYPKAMRVVITAGASALNYFLLYALVKGVVSCF